MYTAALLLIIGGGGGELSFAEYVRANTEGRVPEEMGWIAEQKCYAQTLNKNSTFGSNDMVAFNY